MALQNSLIGITLLTVLCIILSANGQDNLFIEVGTTTNGQTIYMSTVHMSWIDSHMACRRTSFNLKLAPIESDEETILLKEFYEETYGSNNDMEIFWTAGTVLGSDILTGPQDLKWSTNGKPYSEWGYSKWCCRTEPSLTPSGISEGRACVGAQYRLEAGASGNYTFSWSIQNCFEPRRFLCKTAL